MAPSAEHFDRTRFEEVVLYVAESTRNDPNFGRTKLAKVLFYSDLEAFRRTGSAITNAEYQNWQHGPFPPALTSAEQALTTSGAVVTEGGTEEYEPKHLVPTGSRTSDLAGRGVSADQIAIIDEWIAEVANETARDVREHSHDHPGYQIVSRNEVIPYESAFLATEPPPADEVDRLRDFARQQGWLDGDEWKWER